MEERVATELPFTYTSIIIGYTSSATSENAGEAEPEGIVVQTLLHGTEYHCDVGPRTNTNCVRKNLLLALRFLRSPLNH